MWFGDDVDWHSEHSGEEIWSKRGGVASERDLLVVLFTEELPGMLVLQLWADFVPRMRIFQRAAICKGPELFVKALDNRVNESRVRMIR